MTARKILIVEDELIVQLHLEKIVEELGHEVVGTAATTQEALEAARTRPPELVLMDIHLAEGGDGVDTAKELRDRHDCAVVFITAYADDATLERTGPIAAAGYIVKPFTQPAVKAAIKTAFAGHARLQQTQERERSLATALVSMGQAVFVCDEGGRITYANPRVEDLLGWSAHEACDRRIHEVLRLVSASDAERLTELLSADSAAAGKATLEGVDVRTRAGGERTVDLVVETVLEGGSPGGHVLMLRDRRAQPGEAPKRSTPTLRPFGDGTRLLVYSHDTFGLGHLRRNLNLIRALSTRFPGFSALLVTGSPMVHRYSMPKGADYLKMPAVRKVAPEAYEPRTLSMDGAGIHTLRSNLLLRTIRDYDPNVLLVDHSPVGMRGELRPSLEWLAERKDCIRVLGLRDIVDEPAHVIEQWNNDHVYDALRDLYDHVVVYGSPIVYDPVQAYAFPPELVAKTRFVHYVCDEDEEGERAATAGGRSAAPSDLPLIAVSIGGGDGGAREVIGTFLEMYEQLSDKIGFRSKILTGPFVPDDEAAAFRARAAGFPIEIEIFVPSTIPLYREAELVVSTTGYNTATDLLRYARRAVLIPRVLHRKEQLIRAQRLAELGLATCLHGDEVTPQRLFQAIQTARAGEEHLTRAREAGTVPLDGTERFADFCSGLEVWARG